MGCRSDYMEPNERELESIRVAKLIKFLNATGVIPHWGSFRLDFLDKVISNCYGDVDYLDEMTAYLCDWLKNNDGTGLGDKIIYDGKNPESRKLADWWQKHQAADLRREKDEDEARKRDKLIQTALKKLTQAERDALGV